MLNNYEISIWSDYIGSNNYYEEKKLAIIGSNTMTSEFRALSPKLVEDVRGKNTFTFKMYSYYTNTLTGKKEMNPFSSLLINERKVKVKWNDKWYDFVIKKIEETSTKYLKEFTCEDLFVNELGKTGFNLEFDQKLNNNFGTAPELIEKVLKNTDWSYDSTDSSIIQQENEEFVYPISLSKALDGVDSNKTIYVFKSVIEELKVIPVIEKENKVTFDFDFDFYYTSDIKTDYNSSLLIDGTFHSVNISITKKYNDDITSDYFSFNLNDIFSLTNVSNIKYRAKRKIKKAVQYYDDDLKTFVTEYSNNNIDYLVYTKTRYLDFTTAKNLFVNASNFLNTDGWQAKDSTSKVELVPINTDNTYGFNLDLTGSVLNSGLSDMQRNITRGSIYKTEIEGQFLDEDSENSGVISIYIYTENEVSPILIYKSNTGENQFTFDFNLNYEDIYPYGDSKKSLMIKVEGAAKYRLKSIYFYDSKETMIKTAEDYKTLSAPITEYYVISPNNKEEILNTFYSEEELKDKKYIIKKRENYEKARSITASKSNRFNIIQKIAETFDCWAIFKIEHEDDGRIKIENGKPLKKVLLKKEIGEDHGIGFEYGIDLKNIKRTNDTTQISTRTIVSSSVNKAAKNGICRIGLSDLNYTKEDSVYDFDYYFSNGMMNKDQYYNDIYTDFLPLRIIDGDTITTYGYFDWLNEKNKIYYDNVDKLIEKKLQLNHYDAQYTSLLNLKTSLDKELKNREEEYKSRYGDDITEEKPENLDEDATREALVAAYNELKNNLTLYTESYTVINDVINNATTGLKKVITDLEEENSQFIEKKKEIEQLFLNKYSRFIQEGVWQSNEYIEPDLYYLDALEVSRTSSKPKLTYSIDVMRLSSLEEFKYKIFHLGDIGYVKDVEFFGGTYDEGIFTPNKEKIIISEITSNFDDPKSDSIKVQNYNTQFEDLFQRIAAASQSLQFNEGNYTRAANAVDDDGAISFNALQDAFNNNTNLVQNMQNNTVTQNNYGIEIRDSKNANYITRITAGGVFISKDSGRTWRNAINGEGITTDLLTAGTILTGKINLYDQNYKTFGWDSNGIVAYGYSKDVNGEINPDVAKYVKFYQDGIKINSSVENSNNSVNRISIGKIYAKNNEDPNLLEETYGIQIKNNEGETTLETNDNGDLSITGTIHATDGEFKGKVYATDGEFTGEVNATSGTIGGLTIEDQNLYAQKEIEDPENSNNNIITKFVFLDKNGNIKGEQITANEYLKSNKIITDKIENLNNTEVLNLNSVITTEDPTEIKLQISTKTQDDKYQIILSTTNGKLIENYELKYLIYYSKDRLENLSTPREFCTKELSKDFTSEILLEESNLSTHSSILLYDSSTNTYKNSISIFQIAENNLRVTESNQSIYPKSDSYDLGSSEKFWNYIYSRDMYIKYYKEGQSEISIKDKLNNIEDRLDELGFKQGDITLSGSNTSDIKVGNIKKMGKMVVGRITAKAENLFIAGLKIRFNGEFAPEDKVEIKTLLPVRNSQGVTVYDSDAKITISSIKEGNIKFGTIVLFSSKGSVGFIDTNFGYQMSSTEE